MKPDISSIKNPQIRVFYLLWWPQHQIIYDFTSHLTEEQFDYRMVNSPSRKADTPRGEFSRMSCMCNWST